MSTLLQGVLRSNTTDLERRLNSLNFNGRLTSISPAQSQSHSDDSDDEWVNVVSIPGTPARTRPSSPSKRHALLPFSPSKSSSPSNSKDPLRLFPTQVSQRIFSHLSVKDLARCSRVSRKWNKSQTLNYVWFQHYRRDNFHDDSLPPGKWTKRESKQNWRLTHIKSLAERADTSYDTTGINSHRTRSGYASPGAMNGGSGYQTPKEVREEKWRLEAESRDSPGKVEMRAMYKELGGRKSKAKGSVGAVGRRGVRDKGGWDDGGDYD
uniref:F-box domain-containing protein n=1 Tax=Moniliophthora roreri TaxID=221103 RepID=A0A0W0FHX1_MONRR